MAKRRVELRVLLVALITLIALVVLSACEFEVEEGAAQGGGVVQATVPPGGETATVTRVIDGDTIEVTIRGERYRVRYVGINTPERDEACYDDATQANAGWVAGRTVTLVRDVSDTDHYGRLLRYIYVGNTFVNAELVAAGYAEAGYYPPDTAHLDYFNALEAEARRVGRGCHPSGVFE